MNLALWQTRFREYLEVRNFARRTIGQYVAELRPFFAYLEGSGIDTIGGITRDAVEGYRSQLFYLRRRGSRITASTQNYRLSAVRAFTRFLTRERFLLIDPAAEVELPRVPHTLPRTLLTEREAERVVEAPDTSEALGIRDRAMLEVFYCTAIRSRELRSLRLDQLDLVKLELRVEGKGARPRVVPLTESAVEWVEEYLERVRPQLARSDEQTLLFVTSRGGRFHRGPLAKVVRDAARRAGIRKTVTPHVLRHACATHMLKHGAGLRHLQALLGHENASTTQRYTRLEVTDLRRVLERCHPRERSMPQASWNLR